MIPYAALAAAMLSRMAIVLPSSYVNYEGDVERNFFLAYHFTSLSSSRERKPSRCKYAM